jgi:hypothetical protein
MQLSVCNEDGSMIKDTEWKSICEAAALVACTCLECLDPSGCLDPGQPRKKKFFKHHFSTEWNATDTPCTMLAVYTAFFTFLMLTGQQCHLHALRPWSSYCTGISM